MASNPQQFHRFSEQYISLEEYFRLDMAPNRKYEYQDGAIWLMSGGSKAHDDIAFNIRAALRQRFRGGDCSAQGSDMRVQISETAYFFPDVTVTCDETDRRLDTTLIRSPRIVIEVLSPSTELVDRTRKLKAYQACASIQEIVLVSQFAPHAELYRRPEHAEDMQWERLVYEPGEQVTLSSVDVRIPIEEIYQDINFDEPLTEQ